MVTLHGVLCSTNVNFQSVFPLTLNVCHYKTIRINSPKVCKVHVVITSYVNVLKAFLYTTRMFLILTTKTNHFSYLFDCPFSRR